MTTDFGIFERMVGIVWAQDFSFGMMSLFWMNMNPIDRTRQHKRFMMQLKYADITEKIIGCAMKVHSKMGPGYPEIIYARCLAIEFNRIGLRYEKEKNLNVYYDEFIVGGRRVDFMVEEKIVVELKATAELVNKDFVQGLNYLESHRQEIALLINFGTKSLEFKRIINNKNVHPPPNPVNFISEPNAEYNPINLSKNQVNQGFNPDNPFTNPDNPWS